MFCVAASHTLEFCLAQATAFVLMVTLRAFDARTRGINLGEDQANTPASIFHERFYLPQCAPKQRSAKPALCRLAVGQVAAVVVLLCLTRSRHVTQPQIFKGDCFASGVNRMSDHVVGDPVSSAGSQPSIPGMGYGDRSPGLCPAFRALLLAGKPHLQFGSFLLASLEFNLLGGCEIVEPARAVRDGIYDSPVQPKHFLFPLRNYALGQHSSRFEAEANKPFPVRFLRNRDLPRLFVLAMTDPFQDAQVFTLCPDKQTIFAIMRS